MATPVTPQKADIYEEDIGYRSAVSEELLRKIAASVNAINHNAILPLGSIVSSLLPLAKFQALNSNAFVLMSGQNVTDTDYGQYLLAEGLASGTIYLPDARGMALVGVNNGRSDGKQIYTDIALGGYLAGNVKSHSHTIITPGGGGSSELRVATTTTGTATDSTSISTETFLGNPQNTINSIGVNWFIKVWNNAQS